MHHHENNRKSRRTIAVVPPHIANLFSAVDLSITMSYYGMYRVSTCLIIVCAFSFPEHPKVVVSINASPLADPHINITPSPEESSTYPDISTFRIYDSRRRDARYGTL